MFKIILTTSTGRRFGLAHFGWTDPDDARVQTFPTRRAYLDCGTDLILDDEKASAALAMD